MAVLIIDDISSVDDLVSLTQHLLDVVADGAVSDFVSPGALHLSRLGQTPTPHDLADLVAFHDDYTCHVPHHRDGCSCRQDAAHTDPRQIGLVEAARHEGPVAYTRCSNAGSHVQLTDCWMCWSDVQRGALTVEEVLGE